MDHNTCTLHIAQKEQLVFVLYKLLCINMNIVYVEYFMEAISKLFKINAFLILRINPDSKI